MPLDFPSSPTVGQQYNFGIQTWQWDGVSWNIIATVINTTGPEPFRNLVDNGAMNVCQRATSLVGNGIISGVRVIDRWFVNVAGANVSRWTINQAAEAPAGSGLPYSMKYLCTTAAVPAAADYTIHCQRIEGQFLQHLLWGTALAKPLTMSFWVKSNKIGTYVAQLYIYNGGWTYGIPYTINVVDTWEYKTITFPGDTAHAITNDAGPQLELAFWLVAGSNYSSGSSMSTVWNTVINTRAVGQVNVGAAINNYWQVTGIQLEVGSTVTPFEIRAYDREFQKCMRYFQRWNDPPMRGVMSGVSSVSRMGMTFPVSFRASPSATLSASGVVMAFDGSSSAAIGTIDSNYCTPLHAELNMTSTTSPFVMGRGAVIYKSGTGYIDFSAEI